MDSISQAALGAAIGEATLGKHIGKKGAILGAIVATIPDLDVVLYLLYDKFEMLSIHRGFSHSVVFSLLGAFLIAYVLKYINWTKSLNYYKLWLFSWLTLITHVTLDTFTAYGTQLLLPFSDTRFGLDSVNVVDPVYTVPLIIGLICTLFIFKNKPNRRLCNYIGLGISTLYLLITLGIKSHVNEQVKTELAEKNINYKSLLTMPVGVANINWYGIAKSQDSIYMQKYSILNNEEFPFESFPINDHYLKDLRKHEAEIMRWFAKGFYTVEKDGKRIRIYNLQVDMRGIVKDQNRKAPTVGYFLFTQNSDGGYDFSSGAHGVD